MDFITTNQIASISIFNIINKISDQIIDGFSSADRLLNIGSSNLINTIEGSDYSRSIGNSNVINSGSGNDRIEVWNNDNTVKAGDGDDYIITDRSLFKLEEAYDSTFNGEGGNDTIVSRKGSRNTLNGGEGRKIK